MVLHLIGHLQKNKARKAVKIYNYIQTIDSISLAKKINRIAEEENKVQKIFLQINIGNKEHINYSTLSIPSTTCNFVR